MVSLVGFIMNYSHVIGIHFFANNYHIAQLFCFLVPDQERVRVRVRLTYFKLD